MFTLVLLIALADNSQELFITIYWIVCRTKEAVNIIAVQVMCWRFFDGSMVISTFHYLPIGFIIWMEHEAVEKIFESIYFFNLVHSTLFRKIIYYLKTLTIITRTKMVIRDHCNVEIVWKEKTHQSFSRSPPTFIKWEQYGPVWLACIICLTE